MSADEKPPTGSASEEALKLLQALQGWAKDSGHEYGEAAGAAAAGASGLLHDLSEHIATGGQDCTYCPVCRVIATMRSTTPEVRAHLSVAASSLLQAAAGVMETKTPDRNGEARDRVEHIDLDDDGDWEDD